MTEAARIRIGRVRMKNGGADVRVLHTPQVDTDCCNNIRAWTVDVLGTQDRPHAFFAVAFRYDAAYPGGYEVTTSWGSDHFAFPVEMLPLMATTVIRRQITNHAAEKSIMEKLGYTQASDDDLDDPA